MQYFCVRYMEGRVGLIACYSCRYLRCKMPEQLKCKNNAVFTFETKPHLTIPQ